MFRSLTLPQIGKRIGLLDDVLLSLVANRMNLSLNVGALKLSENKPIYDRDRERQRLDKARYLAVNGLGLDDNFAHALLYMIIDESCKQQMIQLQSSYKPVDTKTDAEWHAHLKANLLKLTEAVSSIYDTSYGSGHFAVSSYRTFEDACIASAIDETRKRGIALDLGCATGTQTLRLAQHFDQAIGYDISPHMIDVARKKLAGDERRPLFEELDLDNGIPLPDSSVSFVLANLGTASDLQDIERHMREISRVLEPGGRYLLSFYNRDALVYAWDFLPWPDGLAAEINPAKSCLDVRFGGTVYSVYAKSYSRDEILAMLRPHLSVDVEFASYPTVSPILPDQLFGKTEQRARTVVEELDQTLSTLNYGAYTVVTGQKA